MKAGTLYSLGVGPGDPELLTLKAARILRGAKLIAYFCKAGGTGHARRIAGAHLTGAPEELALIYPMTTEHAASDARYESAMHEFYEASAARVAARLEAGEDVVVVSEGDPFLYGSFMHLHRRLAPRFKCIVVPGISAMSAAWTRSGAPITWGDDVLTVLPGTLPAPELAKRLRATDAAVIMKIGRNLPRVREAIAEAGLMQRAIYVEHAAMESERILPLAEMQADDAPYFSLILIPGQGRRL